MNTTRDCLLAFKYLFRGRVLDFGSGGGKNRIILTPENGEYISFDINPPEDGVVGDVHSAPFADGSFDVIVCNQVLEHVPRPGIVTKEMNRILRNGGVCLVTAPFMFPYHADPCDYFRYTEQGLCQLMVDAGFKINKHGRIGGPLDVVAESIRMSIASPYKGSVGAMRRRLVRFISRIALFFGAFWRSDEIYSNSYVLAEK